MRADYFPLSIFAVCRRFKGPHPNPLPRRERGKIKTFLLPTREKVAEGRMRAVYFPLSIFAVCRRLRGPHPNPLPRRERGKIKTFLLPPREKVAEGRMRAVYFPFSGLFPVSWLKNAPVSEAPTLRDGVGIAFLFA